MFRSEMGQDFYMAIVACGTCFALTVLISLATRVKKSDAELTGLVYSLSERADASCDPWYLRPVRLSAIVLALALALNIAFR
jgi:SSS family solute:Na+ symporter